MVTLIAGAGIASIAFVSALTSILVVLTGKLHSLE